MKTIDNVPNVNEWKAASKILRTAKSLIEKRGWQQGAVEPTSKECAATALEHAFRQNDFSIVEFNYAREALARVLKIKSEPGRSDNDPLDVPYWGRSLMEWNDATQTTKKQVLDTFEDAARLSIQLSKNPET